MDYYNIIGEFITRLQLILAEHATGLDSNKVYDIKAEAHEALADILVEYKLIKP